MLKWTLFIAALIAAFGTSASAAEIDPVVEEVVSEHLLENNDAARNVCMKIILRSSNEDSRWSNVENLEYIQKQMNVNAKRYCVDNVKRATAYDSSLHDKAFSIFSSSLERIVITPDPDRLLLAEARSDDPNSVTLQSIAMYDGASADAVEQMFDLLKDKDAGSSDIFSSSFTYEAVRGTICTKRTDVASCSESMTY